MAILGCICELYTSGLNDLDVVLFLREHWLPPHSVHKAVVLLRRSDATNGCTIVLRGGGSGTDEGELSRLKRVIRRVALVAANCVYEKAFLIKEYAAPEIREGDGDAMNLDDVSLSPFITLEKVSWLACREVLSCVIPIAIQS